MDSSRSIEQFGSLPTPETSDSFPHAKIRAKEKFERLAAEGGSYLLI